MNTINRMPTKYEHALYGLKLIEKRRNLLFTGFILALVLLCFVLLVSCGDDQPVKSIPLQSDTAGPSGNHITDATLAGSTASGDYFCRCIAGNCVCFRPNQLLDNPRLPYENPRYTDPIP